MLSSEIIMVVEDDPTVRRVVARMLEAQGYTVLQAGHGEEALQIAGPGEPPIDVLVTDVLLPGMDGGSLAEELAVLHPGLGVVFMSGHGSTVLDRLGLSLEEPCFLSKPFGSAELHEKVRQALASGPAEPGPGGTGVRHPGP